MQQVRPEETALDLHGLEYDKNDVLIVLRKTQIKLVDSVVCAFRVVEKTVF